MKIPLVWQVREIRALAAVDVSYQMLSREYGISGGAVRDIALRITWEWIPESNDEAVEGVDLLLRHPHLMTEHERQCFARQVIPQRLISCRRRAE